MILGGSVGQIKAIETVKKLGMKALVLDKNEEVVGAKLADFFEPIDIINFEEVEDIARKYQIIGSMTISSDIAVPTSCYVNEKLNLPNQGIGIGEVVTNKGLMREAFKEGNVSSPNFFLINNKKELEFIKDILSNELTKKPYIIKPSDSSGSRGVRKIFSISELEDAYNTALEFSRNGSIIVEEFIDGLEIGAQSFSLNGEMVLCFVHNDTVSSSLIPVGHSFPINLSAEQLSRVELECAKALKSLGIVNGPSNIDIIIDEEGVPHIIEIGARIGATRLPELVEEYTSIDLVELSIKVASGKDIVIPIQKNIPCAAEILCFNNYGTIKKINDYNRLIKDYEPVNYEFHIREGICITPLLSGANNYGYVMFRGSNANEAEEKCTKFLNELKELIEF